MSSAVPRPQSSESGPSASGAQTARVSSLSRWRQRQARRENKRMSVAMAVSLMLHFALLAVTFDQAGLGLPGTTLRGEPRQAVVPDLTVVLATPAPAASQPTEVPAQQRNDSLIVARAAPPGTVAEEAREMRMATRVPVAQARPQSQAPGTSRPKVAAAPRSRSPTRSRAVHAAGPTPVVEARAAPPPPANVAARGTPVVAVAVPDPEALPVPPTVAASAPTLAASSPEEVEKATRAELALERARVAERARIERELREGEEREAQEAARQEAVREEAARQEAAQQEAARQESARQESARQESARQEAARQESARQESARQESARQESARQEAARQEAVRQEAVRQEAARQESARQEAARQEAARQESARQESARQESARQESARQEAARQEAARQEAARQEAARQESARQEAARQEAARQEAARQEAARQEAARQAAARQAAEEAARSQVGNQERATAKGESDDRAGQREPGRPGAAGAGARAQEPGGRSNPLEGPGGSGPVQGAPTRTPLPGTNPELQVAPRSESSKTPPSGGQRRRTLLGRADQNVVLVMYAEGWRQRIEMNPAMDLLREAKKQPHADPVVSVALRSDGSVESVTFNRSSGLPELDDAIRNAVNKLAPYPPFPPDLAREYDVVEIRRVWTLDTAIRLFAGGR